MFIFVTFFIFFQFNFLLGMNKEPNYNDLFKKTRNLYRQLLNKEYTIIVESYDKILLSLNKNKYAQYENMNNLFDESKKNGSTVLKYALEYDSFFDKIKINNKIEFNYLILKYVNTIN